MSANERRAAAALRRQAAEQHGERGGDAAYRAYRSAVPGIGAARKVPTKTQLRAVSDLRNGKKMKHLSGFFTIYDRGYPMWDIYGEYSERVRSGSGRETLASNPDVAFLVNHAGVTMARTTTNGGNREPTLILEERREGGWQDAWVNPERRDVADLLLAIDDGNVDQMSYAFMIPEGGGLWSEDFTEFEIVQYDIDRGDVSAVNYGANPYTDIAARTAEVLNDLDHLPQGALRAAAERLQARGQGALGRERIEVRGPAPRPGEFARRLSDRIERTVERYDAWAREQSGFTTDVHDLRSVKLPWFEVRNATGVDPDPGQVEGEATVYIFDEIGGSFGTNAKDFAAKLEEITAPRINLRINSPGGSVFDAIAIHSTLMAHPAKVTAWIDGYAASAASVIMLAADPYDAETDTGGVRMMPGSQTMIHKASAMDDGNDDDKERMRVFLRRQSENLAGMYAERAGGTPDEWMERMTAETWSFAQESVDLGLADVVVKRPGKADAIANPERAERMRPARHERSIGRFGYRYHGRDAAPAPMQRRDARVTYVRDDPNPAFTVVDPEGGEWTVVDPKDQPREQRSTPAEPKGRSIALIEAQLAALESE
jgi:ATP-dependent protease ClpP protease subunit/phage head maturation protease